jgi:AcrR family transcriptional regulator
MQVSTGSSSGRRRSEQAHQAILQAAREVLEQVGYQATTIEAIAARAGVGKMTIYRWWPTKAALVLEGLVTFTEADVPTPDTGSLASDLLTYFSLAFPALAGKAGTILAGLAAEAQTDPEFAREFQRQFIIPRRDPLVDILRRGVQRGELAPDTNLNLLVDLIYGAKWYRLLLYPAPLDETFARDIIDFILRLQAN